MIAQQGSSNSIGGPPSEASDVPRANGENVGGLITGQDNQFSAYKKGGKVNLSACKVSTHEKSKSSPKW